MQLESKLRTLDIIANVFAWVWVASTVAAIYFLVSAVIFDGGWIRFIVALGVAIFAKGLAKEYLAQKQRMASDPSDSEAVLDIGADSLSGDEQVIQAYGGVLMNSAPTPGTVADLSQLPYTKERIKEALMNALNQISDPAQKQPLIVGYLQLADFQDDVGPTNIGLDLSGANVEGTSTEDLAEHVVNQSAASKRWRELVQKELEVLNAELKSAGHG